MTLIEANRLVAFGIVVLIWLVQVIIYPAFAAIAPGRFVDWHARYVRAVTRIVAPLMFGQVGLLAWLVVVRPSVGAALAAVSVVVAWVVTFVLSVPAHNKLQASGYDREVIRYLVATNWLRTVAWTSAFVFLLLP